MMMLFYDCTMMLFVYVCFFGVISSFAMGTYTLKAQADQIVTLPRSTPLLANQFSGYLQITDTKNLHYMYFESENNPSTDSVIFWTNGGPGCSGLLGLFTEFGPWRPVQNGSLVSNPNSWTKLASLVFLEQPVGVGFSYGTDPSELESYNDYRAAGDNILAIKAFFERFPERAAQPFYIASESYGGHYIPQWTLQVLNDDVLRRRFKGMLVGNPFTSYASGSIAMANVLWGLQMIPRPAWEEFTSSGCADLDSSPYDLLEQSPQCFEMIDMLFDYAGPVSPYALTFPVCASGSGYDKTTTNFESLGHNTVMPKSALSKQAQSILRIHQRIKSSAVFKTSIDNYRRNAVVSDLGNIVGKSPDDHFSHESFLSKLQEQDGDSSSGGHRMPQHRLFNTTTHSSVNVSYDPCTADYTAAYLNDPLVQQALHVDVAESSPKVWAECDDYVNGMWAFNDYLADTTLLYSVVFNHEHKPKDFKMLIFSGDVDGVCATVGTQNWVYNIAGTEVSSLYQPWYYNNSELGTRQQAGYLTMFKDSLSFATVHHAGHEVPAYQPEMALELFSRYLDGSLFVRSEHNSSSEGNAAAGGGGDTGVFPDRASEVIGILFITLGIVGIIFGALWYFRASQSNGSSLADQSSSDDI